MCGYDPFWIYDMRLEQMYLEDEDEENDDDDSTKLGLSHDE